VLSHPSPNFGPRKNGAVPSLIVIHYTAMPDTDAACRTLCNPDTEVSAHYLIAPDGRVMSLVAEDMRAWHAGAGRWGDITDVNSASIGIELSNDGYSPFAAPLMDTVPMQSGRLMRVIWLSSRIWRIDSPLTHAPPRLRRIRRVVG